MTPIVLASYYAIALSLPKMRQKQLKVKQIFLLINIPTEHLNQVLNPFLLDIILPEHVNNLLHRNIAIIITRNQPKCISDIPQIVLAVGYFEGVHELLESYLLVDVENFCCELGEVWGWDVVADTLKNVL